jgi:hypothetical protein
MTADAVRRKEASMSEAQRTSSSRRDFLVSVGSMVGATVVAGALTSVADAKALPYLTAQDPQAQALHYTDDVSKIDASKNPSHTAGAKCSNCKLYQGTGGEPSGPCQLYPGKAVSADGWCMGYQKKA